jgi:hypothetical protein
MTIGERMKEESQLRERIDEKGNKLEQCREIYGEEDVEVEEVNAIGFKCFEEGGEKIYRIWARRREEGR